MASCCNDGYVDRLVRFVVNIVFAVLFWMGLALVGAVVGGLDTSVEPVEVLPKVEAVGDGFV